MSNGDEQSWKREGKSWNVWGLPDHPWERKKDWSDPTRCRGDPELELRIADVEELTPGFNSARSSV